MKKVVILSTWWSFLLSALALLSSYAKDESAYQSQHRYGAIEGIVVTREEVPVSGATVYVLQISRSLLSSTDINGKFTLPNIPIGTHRIIAYKESEGFPNPVWSFYSEAYPDEEFPLVNVQENQTVQSVKIRLGPKASRLFISVIDGKTKQPIRDASVILNHKGKPKTLFKTGATTTDGNFDLLIPSSISINIVVEAQGYKRWRYVKGGTANQDAIRLPPGSSKKLSIQLKRNTGKT